MLVTCAFREAIWLHQLLKQLRLKQDKPTLLLGYNQGAFTLTKNPSNHTHTKHVQLHYHFIHFTVEDSQIILDYVPTKNMVADGLMKGLTGENHMQLVSMFGLNPQSNGSVRNWHALTSLILDSFYLHVTSVTLSGRSFCTMLSLCSVSLHRTLTVS